MVSTTPPMTRIIAGSKSAAKAARRVAMSFCCWRAARSSASSRRPLASPLAMRCTITGGKTLVAPSARASGMPSRTPRAAVASASRIGTRVMTPVARLERLQDRHAAADEDRQRGGEARASRWRRTRPRAGAPRRKRWRRARGRGARERDAERDRGRDGEHDPGRHVACRKAENAMSARVRSGSVLVRVLETCTTCGST